MVETPDVPAEDGELDDPSREEDRPLFTDDPEGEEAEEGEPAP